MANDHVVSVLLKAHTGDYKRQMNEAASATNKFGETAGPVGKSTASLGSSLTKLAGYSYAAKKAFDVTVGSAISWESAFAGVKKTVDGTPQQLAALSAGLQDLAVDLATPAEELANVAAAAGQLGVKIENIEGFTATMVGLGKTTNLSADQAATSLARFMNVMQTAPEDVDRLASTLVELGNNSETTEAEILELATRMAAAAQIAGMSEADVMAFAASLTSVGVEAEAGGTAMSKVFTSMRDAVIDGGDALDTFARVAGTSAQEFAAAYERDPARAVQSFIAGLGRMSAAGESTTGVFEDLELTDERLKRALLSTAAAGDHLAERITMGETAFDENTAAAAELAAILNTTQAKMDSARESVNKLAREIGGVLLPAIGGVAEGLSSGLNYELMNLGGQSIDVGTAITTGVTTALAGLGFRAKDTSDDLAEIARTEAIVERGMEALAVSFDDTTVAAAAVSAAADDTTASLGDMGETVEELTELQKALQSAIDSMPGPLDAYQSAVEELASATAEATASSEDSWEDFADSVDVSVDEVSNKLREQIRDQAEWERNLVEIAERAGAGLAFELAKFGEEGIPLVAELVEGTDEEMLRFAALMETRAEQGGVNLETKIAEGAANAGRRLIDGLASISPELRETMNVVGANAAQGLASGLSSQQLAVIQTAGTLADSVINTVRGRLKVESPSKVFYDIGQNVIDGFPVFLGDADDDIDEALDKLLEDAAHETAGDVLEVAAP